MSTTEPEIVVEASKKNAGRQKGSKNLNQIVEGKILEFVQPTEVANLEAPTPISITAAKRMLKATQKPRMIPEETKQKMLANLAKGRAVRDANRLAGKQLKEKEQEREIIQAKKELTIRKYIIKPKRLQKRKLENTRSNQLEETDQINTEDFTEAETDMEIYKKIKRQERLLKKIEQVKQRSLPLPVHSNPVFQAASAAFKMFY